MNTKEGGGAPVKSQGHRKRVQAPAKNFYWVRPARANRLKNFTLNRKDLCLRSVAG